MRKGGGGKINPALQKAVDDLLKKAESEDFKTRLAVINVAIKLEALKVKIDDPKWGASLDALIDEDEEEPAIP